MNGTHGNGYLIRDIILIADLNIDRIQPHTVAYGYTLHNANDMTPVNAEPYYRDEDVFVTFTDTSGQRHKQSLSACQARKLRRVLREHETRRFAKVHDSARVVRRIVPRLRELQQAPHGLRDEWDRGYYVGLERAIQEIGRYADEIEA